MGFLSSLFKGVNLSKNAEPVLLPADWTQPKNGSWSYDRNESKIKDRKAETDLVMRRLKQKDISSFSFATQPSEFFTSLALTLPETALTQLHISASLSDAKEEDFCSVIQALPQTDIKTFSFKCSVSHKKDSKIFETLANVLPQTKITELAFRNAYYDDATLAPALKKLPPQLEILDLQWNKSEHGITKSVGDPSLELILPQLKNSRIKCLELGRTDVTDKFMPELLKLLKDPKQALQAVHVNDSNVSEETRLEMIYWCKRKQRPATLKNFQKKVPPELIEAPLPPLDELRSKALIPIVAKAGRLPELMKRQIDLKNPLTADDLITRAPNHPPAIDCIRMLGDFDQIFAPELWGSTKEMQKAWDACSRPSDKVHLDGKNGRPLFEKMKREAGMTAVKVALKSKRSQQVR